MKSFLLVQSQMSLIRSGTEFSNAYCCTVWAVPACAPHSCRLRRVRWMQLMTRRVETMTLKFSELLQFSLPVPELAVSIAPAPEAQPPSLESLLARPSSELTISSLKAVCSAANADDDLFRFCLDLDDNHRRVLLSHCLSSWPTHSREKLLRFCLSSESGMFDSRGLPRCLS